MVLSVSLYLSWFVRRVYTILLPVTRPVRNCLPPTVIPNRGAWLEYETDSNDVFYDRIDKNRKLPLTTFIRALGIGTDEEILGLFGNDPTLRATIEKDTAKSVEDGLLEVYRKRVPVNRRRWRVLRPIWTTCSSTPDGTICPG